MKNYFLMSFAERWCKHRQRIWLLIICWFPALWLFSYLVSEFTLKNYRIGADFGLSADGHPQPKCLPWTLYLMRLHADYGKGDYIAFMPPPKALEGRGEALKNEFRVPGLSAFAKQVIAVEGDQITIKNGRLSINQSYVADLTLLGRLHAQQNAYDRNEVVPQNQLFVMGTEERSYDSRYWGYVDRSAVVAKITPIF